MLQPQTRYMASSMTEFKVRFGKSKTSVNMLLISAWILNYHHIISTGLKHIIKISGIIGMAASFLLALIIYLSILEPFDELAFYFTSLFPSCTTSSACPVIGYLSSTGPLVNDVLCTTSVQSRVYPQIATIPLFDGWHEPCLCGLVSCSDLYLKSDLYSHYIWLGVTTWSNCIVIGFSLQREYIPLLYLVTPVA